MEYDVAVSRDAQRTLVKVTGRPTADQMLSMIHVLGIDSDRWTSPVLLVDLREVETMYTNEELVRFGIALAASLSHLHRIASVVPTHRITRLSERAARRSGADVRIFDDADRALEWLLESEGEGAAAAG